jgi:hypothetical protein
VLWTLAELVVCSMVRVSRQLATAGKVKGKVLLDLSEAAMTASCLDGILDRLAEVLGSDRPPVERHRSLANSEGGGLMDPCSHDEAAERVAASALTLALVAVEPDEVADLLVGTGSIAGRF